MKHILFTTIFILLLITYIPFGLTFGIKLIPVGIQPSLGDTERIYEQNTLSQSFISKKDNLAGIGVSIKNPNFANKKNALVSIYDSEKNLIRSITLNGQNIADGKFVKILFDPIKDSEGKIFTWSIESPTSNFDDALEIFLTQNKPEWSLDFKVGEKLTDKSLSYVTLHRPKTMTEVAAKVLSSWINRLTADTSFFISYFLVISILVSFFLYLTLRKRY